MELKESVKARHEETVMALLAKIHKMTEEDEMTTEDIKAIKEAWEAMWYARQVCKES